MANLLLTSYKRLRSVWPIWKYFLNEFGRSRFLKNRPSLNPVQARILGDLREGGISKTSLGELFPEKDWLTVLTNFEKKIRSQRKISPKKSYIELYWDFNPLLDFSNPFVELATDRKIFAIVNSYMEMWTKFRYFRFERTIPIEKDSELQNSQRWHRDPNEKRYIKMFIYLSDVNEKNGPFIYIPESSYGKRWGKLFPQRPPQGSYPETSDLEAKISERDWKTMTGPAGTVLFCDTTGLHKGGYVKEGERLMFSALYTAKSYAKTHDYKLNEAAISKISRLSTEVQWALKS